MRGVTAVSGRGFPVPLTSAGGRFVVAVSALVILSCGTDPDNSGSDPDHEQIEKFVTWTDSLTLQETEDVINVAISVHGNSDDGYVVADGSESQVRVYDGAGELKLYFGREGEGPGEFLSASGAVQLNDGSVLAIDRRGRILRYINSDSTETVDVRLGPVHDLAVLSDSRVLLAGQRRGFPERLHIYDVVKRELVHSFFVPSIPDEMQSAARTAGLVSVDVRNDTIASVFALTDTLYLFGTDGSSLDKRAIPSRFYRPIQELAPGSGPSALLDWVSSFSMFSDVYFAPDDSFIIQYQDREDMMPVWRLLRMTASGDLMFDVVDTPRLLTMDGDRLVFLNPRSITQDKWIFGQLR